MTRASRRPLSDLGSWTRLVHTDDVTTPGNKPLPQHVRLALGLQQGELAADHLADIPLLRQRLKQFQTVVGGLQALDGVAVDVPVHRNWERGRDATATVTIDRWVEPLATSGSHNAVWRVRLSDQSDAVLKVAAARSWQGEFNYLKRAVRRGKPVAVPLSTFTGPATDDPGGETYGALLTGMVEGEPTRDAPLDDLYGLFDSLVERGVVVQGATRYSDHLRRRLAVAMPRLAREGFRLPSRMGQVMRWTDGEHLIHGAERSAHAICAALDQQLKAVSPAGFMLSSREVAFASLALATQPWIKSMKLLRRRCASTPICAPIVWLQPLAPLL